MVTPASPLSMLDRLRSFVGLGGGGHTWDWSERRRSYARWDAMYANRVYLSQDDGGLRETILDELGEQDSARPLIGYFEPTAPIVDAYRQCLAGQWGRQLIAVPDGGDNPTMMDALAKLWRWGNLDEQKDVLSYYAACHGTVGLRIDAITGRDSVDKTSARVRIVPVSASSIIDFAEDGQGNITDVILEYDVLVGKLGESRETVTYRDELSKTRLTRWIDKKKDHDIPNALGVCPFVLLRHRDTGGEYGIPAHFGTERTIHVLNYLLTRFGLSVDRHVFANWFASASAPSPTTFDLGDTTVAYVQTQPGDSTPSLNAIVANLDFNGMWAVVSGLISHVRHRQPELTLAYLESLSGQSGETIAKLLIPFEDRIYAARARYEHSLVSAMRIGLSWGVMMGMWDMGTGTGTQAAADAAFHGGNEDFTFMERPALPPTAYDRQKMAEAETRPLEIKARALKDLDGVLDQREKLRILGYSDKDAEAIIARSSQYDIVPPVGQ